MRKLIGVLMVTAAVALAGCGAALDDVVLRDVKVAANGAALTLEATLSAAELLYEAEQRAAVDRVIAAGGDKAAATAAVAAVRERWAPVKVLFSDAVKAHGEVAALLAQGASVVRVVEAGNEFAAKQRQIVDALRAARERMGK